MALVWAFWPRRACCQLWRSWAWPPSATPKRHPTYKTCFSPLKTHNMAKHWQAGKTPTQFEWNESTSMYFLLSNWWMDDSQHQCDEVVWADPREFLARVGGFFPFFLVGKKHTTDLKTFHPTIGGFFQSNSRPQIWQGSSSWPRRLAGSLENTLEDFHGWKTLQNHPFFESENYLPNQTSRELCATC